MTPRAFRKQQTAKACRPIRNNNYTKNNSANAHHNLVTSTKNCMHLEHILLTQPVATEATPLLSPMAETGVERSINVPSPSCR
jgi:hypothetical protein